MRTSRIIYPSQIRQQAKAFAPAIRKDDPNVSLVTVGHRRFYAYRYEGKVSDCEKAVVLLCYSEKYFGSPDALRVFISTQMYAKRWSIEVFFRNCKQKLAFDKCQLRKQRGIERMWLLLSLVHFLCCTLPDYRGVFEKGFAYFRECLLQA